MNVADPIDLADPADHPDVSVRSTRSRGSRRGSIGRHLSALLNVEVKRSTSGAPYVETLRDWSQHETGDRVFISEGASMLFWHTRTYRLMWSDR
jgi:hypothetical protein